MDKAHFRSINLQSLQLIVHGLINKHQNHCCPLVLTGPVWSAWAYCFRYVGLSMQRCKNRPSRYWVPLADFEASVNDWTFNRPGKSIKTNASYKKNKYDTLYAFDSKQYIGLLLLGNKLRWYEGLTAHSTMRGVFSFNQWLKCFTGMSQSRSVQVHELKQNNSSRIIT